MNKENRRNQEQRKDAKKVLEYNLKVIYKLSFNKYPYLYKALRGELEQFLRDVLNFWKSKDSAILSIKKEAVYFLGTHKGTYEVRQKTTQGVTNKRLNYLCAIGLLNKIEQNVIINSNRRVLRNLTGVNRNMLSYNSNHKTQPINTFKVEMYTTEFLDKCNERAKELQEKGITAGNMSYNQLALNGLKDIAIEVYKEEKQLAEEKKLRELQEVEKCIESLITDKGYTTKQELYDKLALSKNEIDKIFKIFKSRLLKNKTYKAPTKKDKEKYNIKSNCWIIKHKD